MKTKLKSVSDNLANGVRVIGLLAALLLVIGCAATTADDQETKDAGVKASDKSTAEKTTGTKAQEKGSKVKPELEKITLGAGCFWCIEAILERLDGVESVVSGYMGGRIENPTYTQVCSGLTGHAEVVEVQFDPKKLPLAELLDFFWQLHDPTTLNRQGADVGTQYRSAIFYHNDAQKKIAEDSKEKWNKSGKFKSPIVTEIAETTVFFKAEDYHQEYFANNPSNPYCQYNIPPKLKKLGLDKVKQE